MSDTPQFINVPNIGQATLSVANANRDGTTGTYATLFTAGSSGGIVNRVRFKGGGTTTAGLLRIFVKNPTGPVVTLIDEVEVTAVTPSGTVATFKATWVPTNGPIVLPNGWLLIASTVNAETMYATTEGGDF